MCGLEREGERERSTSAAGAVLTEGLLSPPRTGTSAGAAAPSAALRLGVGLFEVDNESRLTVVKRQSEAGTVMPPGRRPPGPKRLW